MSDKYYTPEIEELHVGMELQYAKNDGPEHNTWKDIIFSELNFGDLDNSAIRVRCKFLNKEDIESLGWKLVGYDLGMEFRGKYWYEIPYNDERTGKEEDMNLLYNPINHWLLISQEYDNATRFAGYIKNKSNLKVIMKQLGI